MNSVPRVLIIAGSDSGGGAGIQADIKTVTMLGGHAMTAITAITAQNTLGVRGVHTVPVEMVREQIRACVDDIGVDAVKIGMLGRADLAETVWEELLGMPDDMPIIFDPVMIATSGSVLADGPTIAAFARLMDVATLVTPNLPELAELGGEAAVRAHGCALLAKGGHAAGDMLTDRLIEADGTETIWQDPRIDTPHTHGTGCTLASAIATGLGQGLDLPAAVAQARRFVRIALREAPGLGAGHGPMGHHAVRLDVGSSVRLNQVTLPAADFQLSRNFYRALGLRQIVDAPPRYARFEAAGGATLSIHTLDEGNWDQAVLYYESDDLDAAVSALKMAGIAFDTDPADQSWGWREARLTDPAGNRICLYQAGEMRRFPPWRIDA